MKYLLIAMLVLATGPVMSFPVTIRSCDRLVEFDAAPTAAMASDGNMVEMMLVLGLGDHMTGMTGVGSIDEIMSEFRPVATSIPLISRNYSLQGTDRGTCSGFLLCRLELRARARR